MHELCCTCTVVCLVNCAYVFWWAPRCLIYRQYCAPVETKCVLKIPSQCPVVTVQMAISVAHSLMPLN